MKNIWSRLSFYEVITSYMNKYFYNLKTIHASANFIQKRHSFYNLRNIVHTHTYIAV